MFCLKRRCNLFGKVKTIIYCSWVPQFFYVSNAGKEKQENVASSTLLMKLISMNSVHATLFINELISMNSVACYTVPVEPVPTGSDPVQSSKCIEPGLTQ